ncbi:MAG: VWA domain-containing protein [Candidatus Kapaibacteriota bacterium]
MRYSLFFCLFFWIIGSAAAQEFEGLRENMGAALNDGQDQLLPVFSQRGDTLFFSEDGPDGKYRIMFSVRDAYNDWSPKRRFASLSPMSDGSQYVFAALNKRRYLVNGIFSAPDSSSGRYRQNKGLSWANTDKGAADWNALSFNWFDTQVNGRFANAFLHQSSKTLWLSFAEGNNRDIYVCLPENPAETDWGKIRWGSPTKLPETLNSSSDDTTPFLSADGRSLYFASNRPGGYGAEDIYVARRNGIGWLDWSAPENLGFQVNSNKAELYFTITPDGKEAWFVSYKFSAGAGDLFRIRRKSPSAPDSPEKLAGVSSSTPSNPNLPTTTLPETRYKPNNIVCLLDHSGSMNKDNRLSLLRSALGVLVGALRPVDKISLHGFGDAVFPIYRSESIRDRDTIVKVLEKLRASSATTNGSAAILEGYKTAEKHLIQGANNEIFLITDGVFTISPSVEMLIRAQPQIQLTVVVIAQTEGGDKLIEQFRRFQTVQTLKITDLERDKGLLLENVKKNAVR